MQPLCHDDDSSALLQFKESFVMSKNACIHPFAYPKMASWKLEGDNRDCCSWDGVECDGDTGHVIGLDLSNSCLYGSLVSNSSLFGLVQLQSLNLAFNNFSFSQIPSAFSHLSKLTYLNLSLKGLVQNLTNLRDLRLSYVQISSPVPEILSNLSDLKTLLLIGCGLYGQFPVGIFKLPKLQYLRVGYNQDLMGYLPEFYSSNPLKILGVRGTSFSGKLPASIGNLDSLNELWIGSCNFSGHIPPSLVGSPTTIFASPKLRIVDLSANKFTDYPYSMTIINKGKEMVYLKIIEVFAAIDLSSNEFNGKIPEFIGNLNGFQLLNLSNNNLTGLCGNPLSKKCENPEPTPLPTSSFEEDQDSWFHIEFDWKIILMGYGSGLVIGVVVGNIVAEKIRTWKRQHKRGRSRITLFTIY
uniref:Leucine-rich repeat-containing N-terminal plant-type domain-containing protein n=1 Tax=Fagus sylvatica TaxID=28930 RepID=A0A2N9HQ85_FAGSY